MRVIWVWREAIYFCEQDWTGSISLIRLDKLGGARRLSAQRWQVEEPAQTERPLPLYFPESKTPADAGGANRGLQGGWREASKAWCRSKDPRQISNPISGSDKPIL